jgi:NAD(P)-dependent dehydrogenase (short-subunit alcohol dehydrogenase family)
VQEAVENYTREHDVAPQVIFLENHGLFVSADTGDDALGITRRITGRAKEAWKAERAKMPSDKIDDVSADERKSIVHDVSAAMRRAFQKVFGRTPIVMYSWGEPEKRFLQNPERDKLSEVGPLVPDQVLYCNGGPMLLEGVNDIGDVQKVTEEIVEKHEDGIFTPVALLVNGVGLFCAGPGYDLADSALVTMEAALTMLDVASCFGGARALGPDALNNIRESEWESYRHHVISGGSDVSDLSGAVAVVTGGGSGLGRGISIGLARKGMNVVLADIDVDGAAETADRISRSEAPGRGIPMEVDVTDEDAVDELFYSVVKKLGGVDLLVNCAGIAPPAALLDFPVGAFRKALDINLTGYMLMAREAARVMKRQGMGGSIVNISSKSGLDASKNHSAYNATKAGEIHMARGWALELAEYKIRVNVVCPGNVFQESNIWNEDYIKALAEKRGLEPDEVIPYYINMTALKEEIKWDDIANAVAFFAGEGAAKITGQTLVVDAGQVFVR